MTMTPDPVTTVKVPRSLRQRIARNAALSQQTAADFLTDAVARWERDHRMSSVQAAYAELDDRIGYRREVADWDTTTGDGWDG